MRRGLDSPRLPLFLCVAGGLSAGLAGTAEAAGTHFLVELNTGLGQSAYESGSPGLAYGASFGIALKLKAFPVRWYLLGAVAGRNGTIALNRLGIPYDAERRDLDLYAALRTVIPVWSVVRVYFEPGIGQRFATQTIHRGADLGSLSASSRQLLLVLALGVEARLNETFSIGLRGEYEPLDPTPDLAETAADIAPTRHRTALMAQVGIHF